jgi:hypothetical protein
MRVLLDKLIQALASPLVRKGAERTVRRSLTSTQYKRLPKRTRARLGLSVQHLVQCGVEARTPPAVVSLAAHWLIFGYLAAIDLYQREGQH